MLQLPGYTLVRHPRLASALFVFCLLTLSLLPVTAYAATPHSTPQVPQRPASTFQSENLGGNWFSQSSPNAAVSWGSGRTDEFIVGENAQLYHYWLTPTPHLESWGGYWAQSNGLSATRPAAVSWGSPRLDVFLVGQDGLLYHYWQNGGNVYYLEGLPRATSLFSSDAHVAATTWGSGRLDVFVVGTNGDLFHYWQSGGNTWSWSDLGGTYVEQAAPAAVTWGPGRLDVFIVGKNGLMHYSQQSSWWQSNPPFSVQAILSDHIWNGGANTAPPSVVSWGSGRIDLFGYTLNYNAQTAQLYHAWSQGGVTFSEEPLPLTLPFGATTDVKAVTWGAWRLDLFAIGTPGYPDDGAPLYHIWQQNDSVFQIETIDNNATSYNEVAATTWGPGRLDVFAVEGPTYSSTSPGNPLSHFWQD